ncbi:MAG: putative transposase [Maricaulis maris]|jgi:putative transposase|uniref:IS6 family transposase n=1 Tax=Maricaulis maris TaxID=74318 RepID=UPI0026F3526D|nr:IS6 family transposase [Maricaulis maris]
MRNPFRYFKTSPEIIRLPVLMYIPFPLSLRNVENLLHERGIDITHEAVRFWWNRFGPLFAKSIRKGRVENGYYSNWAWHLVEVSVRINGESHYFWRAVDHEGEVLETFVTKRRDSEAALRFLRKAMKRFGCPEAVVTDKLPSYNAAMRDLGFAGRQETGRWLNNRAENSHQPLRRRKKIMMRFRSMQSLQKFAAVQCPIHNHFNLERHFDSRSDFKENRATALVEWRQLVA